MGRIVAIGGGDLKSTHLINQYIVDMVKETKKHFLFIGTASGDYEGYIENIKRAYEELGCECKALSLTKKPNESVINELLSWADIIYVGGGDTFSMMELWRETGLDKKLKAVYEKDSALLTGISAGAMCWFQCGHSDSEIFWTNGEVGYGWVDDLLAIHPFAYCPHYEERTESFDNMLPGKNITGLAMESDTAFVEENGKIHYIKCREAAEAYIVKSVDGKIEKQRLETHLLR